LDGRPQQVEGGPRMACRTQACSTQDECNQEESAWDLPHGEDCTSLQNAALRLREHCSKQSHCFGYDDG
jgi:hypothetical protein